MYPHDPPAGLTVRRPTAADADAVTALYNGAAAALDAPADQRPAETLAYWGWIDLAHDAWLLVDATGRPVGYEDVIPNPAKGQYALDGCVAPDWRGRGLGSWLLDAARRRACEHAREAGQDAAACSASIEGVDDAGRALLAAAGFVCEHRKLRFQRHLDAAPTAPVWPAGVRTRTFDAERDGPAVHALVHEAFSRSMRGYRERALSYVDWWQFSVARDGFDPTLWRLAEDADGTLAGVCLCPHDRPIGWIRQLAVDPARQRRGLGRALLLDALGGWWDRERPIVGLTVQDDNLAAVALYRSTGFDQLAVYEHHVAPLLP